MTTGSAPRPAHPDTIFVTSLFDMPRYVEELMPARVVSVIQPEFLPERPACLAAEAYLHVAVHDIVEPRADAILAARSDVESLVRFIDAWEPAEGALLAHCYAGISRSTATALIAAAIKTGDPDAAAAALRAAAPHARPNRHIVGLADQVLGLHGRLVAAYEAMGESTVALAEAPLTTLRIAERPA